MTTDDDDDDNDEISAKKDEATRHHGCLRLTPDSLFCPRHRIKALGDRELAEVGTGICGLEFTFKAVDGDPLQPRALCDFRYVCISYSPTEGSCG